MAQQGLPIIQGKDPLAGLRQALTGFVGSTLQGAQNQQLSQQLGQLFPQQNFQGITNPLALQAGVQAGLQQQQQQGALGLQAARPISPSQIITQKQLDRINLLESKARQGTITQPEKDELQRSLSRNRPLVEFGALPGQSRFLSPSERVEQAKQPLTRPLTPTETKGVDVAINSILGKPKSLLSGLFGIRPGAAIPQNVMEQLWEQAMLETGYDGRSKIAKKQIESQFDRRVRDLNKGKGVGVLANQYQWNRGKYNAKVGAGSPKGLGSIWGRLNPEEQETARGYINQKIEPKKIVDWFNTHGGGFQFPKQIQ